MPNRIIKDSICTSEEIDKLTPFQEVMFYRLIVNCDDYGRIDARAKILKSKLFPLKDVRSDQIEAALDALASAELVILYEIDGKPFAQMKTWDRHQRIRSKVSKYPAPTSTETIFVSNSRSNVSNLLSNVSNSRSSADKCRRNPIQSNPIQSESESVTRVRADGVENAKPVENSAFERFWSVYPKKVGKAAALKAFAKVKVPTDRLVDALEKQTKSDQWRRDNGRFIPNPATWLNQGRWDDEPIVSDYQPSFDTDDAFAAAMKRAEQLLKEAEAHGQ